MVFQNLFRMQGMLFLISLLSMITIPAWCLFLA